MSIQTDRIHPLRAITYGVLDTSGLDGLWIKMLARDQDASYLSHPPKEYASLDITIHDAVTTMYQKLVDNCRNSVDCGVVKRIKSVTVPMDVDDEPARVQLQAEAALSVLETL